MNKKLVLWIFNLSFVFCLYDCDFDTPCEWSWENRDEIRVLSAGNSTFLPDQPLSDSEGHFLYYGIQSSEEDGRFEIVSPPLEEGSGYLCSIDLEVNMNNMDDGFIIILARADNATWIVQNLKGNSENTWQRFKRRIGRVTQRFRLVIEIEHPKVTKPLHVAIDNLRLVNCIRDRSNPRYCEPHHFRCSQGMCYERDRVCDLIPDCPEGEDERQECDLLPKGSRCNFEDGFCGWTNIDGNHGNWTRSNGSIPKHRKGPNFDHTYKNITGIYIFANFSPTRNTFGQRAILRSNWFRPPPLYHRLPGSSYHHL